MPARDEFFEALDGQRLRVKGHDWLVEVYAVFEDAERRWVQLALDGDDRRVVTLRLAPGQRPRHAVRSLSAWLTNPRASKDVLAHVA